METLKFVCGSFSSWNYKSAQWLSGYHEIKLRAKVRRVYCVFKMQNGIFQLEVVIWLHTLGFMDKDTEASKKEMFFVLKP